MPTTDISKPVKVASIIHEIKQPVSAMTMLAELMLANINEPATEERDKKIESKLNELKNQGELCSRIIENIQHPHKQRTQDLKPSDINIIIIRALDKIHFNGYSNDIIVRRNLEANLPEVPLDNDAIFQLLTNLITNAVDSMKNSAKKILTVKSWKTNNGISITVKDTGCGIEKDDNSKIFDSFYTTKGDNGMGLGLSICKEIVNNHKGTITVNTQKNMGTQFNVLLPLDSSEKSDSMHIPKVH